MFFKAAALCPGLRPLLVYPYPQLEGARLATHKESLRLHRNHLNEPFICAGIDPLLAEFDIRHRLESCVSD